MKGCALPNHCEAVAPLLNKETMEEEYRVFLVLLPHKLLAHFVKEDPDLLAAWSAKPRGSVTHCAAFGCDQKFQVEPSKMLRLGLHGDGVPFATKMRDSLECLSWSILTDKTGMRLLFATFAKQTGQAEQLGMPCCMRLH